MKDFIGDQNIGVAVFVNNGSGGSGDWNILDRIKARMESSDVAALPSRAEQSPVSPDTRGVGSCVKLVTGRLIYNMIGPEL